jgi:nicotinamidase-related amidase
MDALLVVDMQEGILRGEQKHDLPAVVERIDRLASRVRERGGHVVFVQHDGSPGDAFAPASSGWPLLAALGREPRDPVVRKTLNDAFCGTCLAATLARLGVSRVLVAGWATDLCVDATVRSAAAHGYPVVVVSDCHTVSDRPHLPATRVIEHHQWVWSQLIAPHPVSFARAAELA